MDDLRERVARIIIDAASNLKDGMPNAEKYAAKAVHDVYREHLTSAEAVERAVDAIDGRAWSSDIRTAILAAMEYKEKTDE